MRNYKPKNPRRIYHSSESYLTRKVRTAKLIKFIAETCIYLNSQQELKQVYLDEQQSQKRARELLVLYSEPASMYPYMSIYL